MELLFTMINAVCLSVGVNISNRLTTSLHSFLITPSLSVCSLSLSLSLSPSLSLSLPPSLQEHCLMGIKGTVRRNQDGHFIHANIDLDIIISEEVLLCYI